MTTNEALARRWLASKHWGGWRKGMVDHWGDVVHDSWPDGSFCTSELVDGDDWHRTPERAQHEKDSPLVPDLDHPGTRAFLREDLKRAFEQKWRGMDGSSFEVSHGGNRQEWRVEWRNLSNGGGWMLAQLGTGDTEAEALIAALEAAPGE